MGTGLDCFLQFPRVVFSFSLFSLSASSGRLLGYRGFSSSLFFFSFLLLFSLLNTVLQDRPSRPSLIHVFFFFLFWTVLNTISLTLFVLDTFVSFYFGCRWLNFLGCFEMRSCLGDFCNNGTNGCVYDSYLISSGIRKLSLRFLYPCLSFFIPTRVTSPVP